MEKELIALPVNTQPPIDAKKLLDDIVKTESGQKEDISKIIDKLRDKFNNYDLSFITKSEKEFLMELIVINQLVFKNSVRIPKIITAYLDLSKSQDGQFLRTVTDLYKIEQNTNQSFLAEIPNRMGLNRLRR